MHISRRICVAFVLWGAPCALLCAESPAETSFNEGLKAIKLKDWTKAAVELRSSHQLRPGASTCYILAYTYANLNQPRNVLEYADLALKAGPPRLSTEYRRGLISLVDWARGVLAGLSSSSGGISLLMSTDDETTTDTGLIDRKESKLSDAAALVLAKFRLMNANRQVLEPFEYPDVPTVPLPLP